jgi:hypothetical protein
VLNDPKEVKTPLQLIMRLPKDKAATIFLEHSELLFLDHKCFASEFFAQLGEAIEISGRGDINVIFANSRPENAKAILETGHVQLLGPPDCSRWKEEHVRAFVDQRLSNHSGWSSGDKEALVKLGTTIGAVGYIEGWTHTDPKKLPSKLQFAAELGKRWNALKIRDDVLEGGRGTYPPP